MSLAYTRILSILLFYIFSPYYIKFIFQILQQNSTFCNFLKNYRSKYTFNYKINRIYTSISREISRERNSKALFRSKGMSKLYSRTIYDPTLIFPAHFPSPTFWLHSATRLVRLDTYYFAFHVRASWSAKRDSSERINRPGDFQIGTLCFSNLMLKHFWKMESLSVL